MYLCTLIITIARVFVASTAYYGNLEDNEPLDLQSLLRIGELTNLWQHS
jgi:hypothetical protein